MGSYRALRGTEVLRIVPDRKRMFHIAKQLSWEIKHLDSRFLSLGMLYMNKGKYIDSEDLNIDYWLTSP